MATNPLVSGMKRVQDERLSEEAENLSGVERTKWTPGVGVKRHETGWDSILADVKAFRDLAARLPDSPSPELVSTFQETAKDLTTRVTSQRQQPGTGLEDNKYNAILSYLGKAETLGSSPVPEKEPSPYTPDEQAAQKEELAQATADSEEKYFQADLAANAPGPGKEKIIAGEDVAPFAGGKGMEVEAAAPERSMRQDRGAAAQRAFAKSKDHQIFEGKGGYEYAYNPADDSFTIISSPKSRGGQVVDSGSKAHKAIAAERGRLPKLEGGGTYTEAALAGAAKASEAVVSKPEMSEPSRQDKRFARQEKREEKMAERSKEDRGLMAFLRKNKPQKDDAVADAE